MHLQFSVLPGHEHDWSLVQVALTDITARKKAEAYLEFLGKHDVLTKLYNRSFYVDELNRLERKGPSPVTIIMADLNGLKTRQRPARPRGRRRAAAARRRGARQGDREAVPRGAHRRRRVRHAAAGHRRTRRRSDDGRDRQLVELNNQFYPGSPLSFSMGAATCQRGERLEAGVKRADLLMYEEKRATYASQPAGTRTLHWPRRITAWRRDDRRALLCCGVSEPDDGATRPALSS